MRSVLAEFLGTKPADVSGNRPEAVRRETIGFNARAMTVLGGVAVIPATYLMVHGQALPVILAALACFTGLTCFALYRAAQFEWAAAAQSYVTVLAGLILTAADPSTIDFGLAIALLGPIYASLVAKSPVTARAWVLFGAAVAIAALELAGVLHWPERFTPTYGLLAGAGFVVAGLAVARSAGRLSAAVESYERNQVAIYRHLVENVRDAVLRFGSEGAVQFSSKSAEKLFGANRYELAGQGFFERLHILDRPQFMSAFAEANRDGRGRVIEVRMRRDDPQAPQQVPVFFWLEAALSPVSENIDANGRYEVVALLRDVSVRRQQDQEMRQARRDAEDASIAKTRFLATIGHELRTPLNAIVGFSEMMTSGVVGELSSAHREYAEIIHRSGHHLLDVVNMLLDMSRLEAGKFELQAEPFEPHALVEPCFKMVDSMARERSIRLTTDLPRQLPIVTADERACRQILINLLSNAVKFSHDGGTVTLTMKRQASWLNITVIDHGIGMGDDSVRRIGEPFFQANDGLSRRYEGTGLGLSIVKGLVDLHKGSLSAVSSPGDGTAVTVLLPLNGPVTKIDDTTQDVTPLHREQGVTQLAQWQDERRRAL